MPVEYLFTRLFHFSAIFCIVTLTSIASFALLSAPPIISVHMPAFHLVCSLVLIVVVFLYLFLSDARFIFSL